MIDVKTVKLMLDEFEIAGNVDTVWGGETFFLKSVEDVQAYLSDRTQYAANHFGVTKAQYLEWLEHFGTPRCFGVTAKGKPCRNYLSGSGQLEIKEWLRRDGGYCAVHGGEGREEARARGRGSDE